MREEGSETKANVLVLDISGDTGPISTEGGPDQTIWFIWKRSPLFCLWYNIKLQIFPASHPLLFCTFYQDGDEVSPHVETTSPPGVGFTILPIWIRSRLPCTHGVLALQSIYSKRSFQYHRKSCSHLSLGTHGVGWLWIVVLDSPFHKLA